MNQKCIVKLYLGIMYNVHCMQYKQFIRYMFFYMLFLDELITIENLKNVLLKTLFKIPTIEHLCYSKPLNCLKLFEIILVHTTLSL